MRNNGMRHRNRQRVMLLFAVLACAAVAAKFVKAAYRGEAMQSRVRPLN
jgi:hypothetical protein